MTDAERLQLKTQIEAGRARQFARMKDELAERGADARDVLTRTAREHPVLLIAGGLAIGIALSTLIPRSPTRKLSKRSLAFLATVAELGIAYGRQAMEAAGDAGSAGKDRLGDLGGKIANGAGKLRERLAQREDA